MHIREDFNFWHSLQKNLRAYIAIREKIHFPRLTFLLVFHKNKILKIQLGKLQLKLIIK